MEHHHSLWTDLLNAALHAHVPDEIVMATLAAIVLAVIAFVARRGLSVEAPGKFQQALEVLVGGFAGILDDIIPHHGRRHIAIIGGFGAFILIGNLFGLIPTLTPPTQAYSITLACALIAFFYYNVVGIREVGALNHFKHLLGPVLVIAPLMFFIEVISHLARNLSLSMRLFGNIFGEHTATGVFYELVPFGGPLPMMFLGLFAAFLQAFIFTVLTMIYIALATEH